MRSVEDAAAIKVDEVRKIATSVLDAFVEEMEEADIAFDPDGARKRALLYLEELLSGRGEL